MEKQNLEQSVERESQTESFRDIGKYLSRTIFSPAFGAVSKLGLAVLLNKGPGTGISNIEAYFLTSSLIDLGEVAYRAYSPNVVSKIGNLEDGKPFSCLERHLAYDIPKAIVRKARNYLNERRNK